VDVSPQNDYVSLLRFNDPTDNIEYLVCKDLSTSGCDSASEFTKWDGTAGNDTVASSAWVAGWDTYMSFATTYDSDGDLWVAYAKDVDGSTRGIYARYLDYPSSGWQSAETVDVVTNTQFNNPSIGIDVNNDAYVIYQDDEAWNEKVYFMKRTDGSWSSKIQAGTSEAMNPVITVRTPNSAGYRIDPGAVYFENDDDDTFFYYIPKASADRTFTGEASGDQFGFSVSNAGNVDNDNYDDVIIGAPYNDDGGSNAGRAYIYSYENTAYVSSNTATYGYIQSFGNAQSDSDSGAYAVLSEDDVANGGTNEDLYVDGLGTERQQWTESGTSPFLEAVDGSNNITTSGDNDEHGDFTFQDSTIMGEFSSSSLRLYCMQEGDQDMPRGYVHDGSTWQNIGQFNCLNSYGWVSRPITSYLDTKDKIDGAKMYVVYVKNGKADTVHIDAARIYWAVTTLYMMEIEFNTTNVKYGSDYTLQLNYSTSGTETSFGVLVYNNTSSSWDDLGWQGDLTATSFTTKDYTLNSSHRLGSGYVRVRYIGRNETSDTTNSTLYIEYHRVVGDIKFTGEAAGANFGWSVGNVSDINEDGSYDDVIVGAPGYSSDTGRAYIFHGGSSMDSTADVTLTGENSGDKFGYSVHGVGDIDDDGAPDVAVGAPYYHNGATADAGIVYVYKGGSSMDSTYDYFSKGTQANEHFGWSVSMSLNVDGSVYYGVAVGAPHYDNGGDTDAGETTILTMIPEYPIYIVPFVAFVLLLTMRRRKRRKGVS
jgi:hypothetical protein